MASVLKVDKLDPQSGTALEIGTSGDTITVPSGATFAVSGTMNASSITAGTVATARLGSGTASSSTVLYGDQTYKAEPSGTYVLLNSTTTSDVASYTTSGYADHSKYSFYKVYARLEFVSNGISLRFGFRASGSTLTASDYRSITNGMKNTAGTLAATTDNSWDVGEPVIATNISYGYPTFITAEVYHDVSGGIGHYSMMKGTMMIPRWNGSATEERLSTFSILYDNSAATDGFSFFASSGNIYRGEMYVYGVAK